jgi:isoprenylcysteine carboxyl methyltransferase (ICMT) family protein YpbQ
MSLRFIVFKKVVAVNIHNLMSDNAKEYGKRNMFIFDFLYFTFMGGCLIEAYIRKTQFDNYMIIGLALFLFAYLMFIYVVLELKGYWTNKLIIAENHQLNTSFLYKHLKHPGHFFCKIPEVVGFALICKAKYVFIIVFPIWFATLIVHIIIEEKMMRSKFPNY